MTGRILIVDDSLTVRMDLAEALDAAGLESVGCASVAEARRALADETFALLILDVLLPDGDGVSLLEEIRKASSNAATPVMLLSTEAEVRDRIRGLSRGADEYVGKPYETTYIVARARQLARRGELAAPPGRGSVLVIDDSATFRDELTRALEGAGHRVLTAATGEDGLRVAAHSRPSAIIVDGVLPGIDGATVIRRVRLDAALRGTPCILLTASDDAGAELIALDAGADSFVRKEGDVGVLLARLSAVFRNASVETRSDVTASLLGPKKILAVDDSPTYLDVLGDVLRAGGYEVAVARSGEEALELLPVQVVDCILLDLLMPGLGGEETCRLIKARAELRDIPLIMLTASEDRDSMIRGLGAGADDYISKSSEPQVLKARVAAQLRRRQFEDENRHIRDQLLRREIEATEARAARELADARAELLADVDRKNQELEAFSYTVSHDLRAPLRSIEGFTKALLEDHASGLHPDAATHLSRVLAATYRMGQLIDALLELARIGRADMHREPVDLSSLARLVAAELSSQETERDVKFVIEDGVEVEGDPRLLRVLLDNLLGNAWKFTRKSPGATIEFGTTSEDGQPAYFIRDEGAGFNMDYGAKLFSPFQRLHAATQFPGTGIGLATVRRIVERHGGRVWAEGAVGKGARFSFCLAASPGRRP